MTLLERINEKIKLGYTNEIAESIVGQEVIIEAISLSSMTDRVLLKGGIVMYNLTSNARRATRDLDFDLIRYDISKDSNIDLFIELLNKSHPSYRIKRVGKITTLHQEDYQGKRTYVEIKDKTYSFTIKLDIGIHTLFAIEQQSIEFEIVSDNKKLSLLANPIEQLVGEKLYSLAKHGVLSTRYKDVFDIYYLVEIYKIDKELLKKCLSLLIEYGKSNVKDLFDLCNRIEQVFDNKIWYERFITSDQDWLDEKNYKKILETIVSYIFSL